MKWSHAMLRRIFSGTFLILFLSLTGLLLHHSVLRPEILPIGAPMPKIAYRTGSSVETLQPDSLRMTMVVYFHSDCQHCRYQLQTFNENTDFFQNTRLILLTSEEGFFEMGKMDAWRKLTMANNVTWGVTESEQFVKYFDPKIKPTVYIFNRAGTLFSTMRGEVKLEKILKALRKNGGSGTPFQRL
jgi:hypothetical protein